MHFFLDFCRKSVYKGRILFRGAFSRETILERSRCGVLRRRLVTEVVGGSGKRPAGLDAAPSQKATGGAPRGGRPFSERVRPAPRKRHRAGHHGTGSTPQSPFGASFTPSSGWRKEEKSQTPGATRRGNEKVREQRLGCLTS